MFTVICAPHTALLLYPAPRHFLTHPGTSPADRVFAFFMILKTRKMRTMTDVPTGSYTCSRASAVQAPAAPGLHDGERVVMVDAARSHSAANTSADGLLTCGRGKSCPLRLGGQRKRHAPARLGRAAFGPVLMVVCGGYHALVVTEAGLLFAFGGGLVAS